MQSNMKDIQKDMLLYWSGEADWERYNGSGELLQYENVEWKKQFGSDSGSGEIA